MFSSSTMLLLRHGTATSTMRHSVSRYTLRTSRLARRTFSEKQSEPVAKAAIKDTAAAATKETKKDEGWWHSAQFWGAMGALAGWGMSGSAIYDAAQQGPEVISLTMTPVLIVYSALFARWAWVVQPRNTFLAACHATNVMAQSNQLRRALEYKMNNGQEEEVKAIGQKAAVGGIALLGGIAAGPTMRSMLTNANLGVISTFAAADAGPFTVHFWAPMSKWMISGASFLELDRPTEKISLAQYSALTLTGFFFSRYSLLVTPINYNLCAVNVALFASSGWHLGRKVNADYLHIGEEETASTKPAQ